MVNPAAPPTWLPPGWHTYFDVLQLKPRTRGLDYAAVESGDALALGTGSLRRFEYGEDTGFRTGVSYLTNTGWAVGLQYSTIDFQGSDSVSRPPDNGQLFATRTHPDSNQEAEFATARGTLDFETIDLIASRAIYANRFSYATLFGGLRWASVDHDQDFAYDGRDFLMGAIVQRQEVQAFGLRMGSSADWRMAGGFGISATFAGSLLHGRFDTSNLETNLDGQQLMAEMSDKYDDLVTTLELTLGISWQASWFTLLVGYELDGWFNVNNRALFVDDQHEGVHAPLSNDVLLHGYFIRAIGML